MDSLSFAGQLASSALIALAAFGISRGFGISFKGWGIELRVEKQQDQKVPVSRNSLNQSRRR